MSDKRYEANKTKVLIKDNRHDVFLDSEAIARLLNQFHESSHKARQRENYISGLLRKNAKKKRKIKKLVRRIFILERMVIEKDNDEAKNEQK